MEQKRQGGGGRVQAARRSGGAISVLADGFAKIRPHRPAYQLVLYAGLLVLLGLIVMYAIGPQRATLMNYAYGSNYDDNYFFMKQLTSAALAAVAFCAMAFFPYQKIMGVFARRIFLTGLALSLLLVIAGAVFKLPFAEETLGAYRWFQVPGFGTFQPSELLKFGALVFMAGFLGLRARQGKINSVQDTLVPLAIAMGAALFTVVVLQKDLGTGIALVAIVLPMLVVGGVKGTTMVKIIGGLGIIALLAIFTSPHRLERVMTFIQGDTSSSQTTEDTNNYHIRQARIAIGSGALFGLGIGKSVQASGYLPEAINDSIFAIMGETFGFVGLMAILGLFSVLLLSLLKILNRLADMRLRLVLAGVFGWIGSHVILNVAAMTGMAPLTGIPLPLLSYGGTSMLFIAAALGLAFQLSRYTTHKPVEEGSSHEDSSGRRWVGRTRYTSSRRR